MNGGSQAVRLPKSCRFEGTEVEIVKQDGGVLLKPVRQTWSPEFLSSLGGAGEDLERPEQGIVDPREEF